jgi:hypothetical protein
MQHVSRISCSTCFFILYPPQQHMSCFSVRVCATSRRRHETHRLERRTPTHVHPPVYHRRQHFRSCASCASSLPLSILRPGATEIAINYPLDVAKTRAHLMAGSNLGMMSALKTVVSGAYAHISCCCRAALICFCHVLLF